MSDVIISLVPIGLEKELGHGHGVGSYVFGRGECIDYDAFNK